MMNGMKMSSLDLFGAYSTRSWMGVERPYVAHNRIRLLSQLFGWNK